MGRTQSWLEVLAVILQALLNVYLSEEIQDQNVSKTGIQNSHG